MICDKSIDIKMIDTCTCCCNGCSSRRQGYTYRYSFPKKLLVATTVLVVIAMIVMPSEARTLEHKIRHERRQHEALAPTKDLRMKLESRVVEHRRRPHRKQTVLPQAKDTENVRQKNVQSDRFKTATRKITKKLTNTRRFFIEERKVLNETREYRDGMPDWLPTINFVDIHFYNYKKRGATMSERKFAYLMPKLYKSLVEYQEIFTLLIKVEVEFADDPFCSYNKTRHELIGKTLHRLYSTIAEVRENMVSVNIPVPQVSKNKNLQVLEKKVDAPQCLKNDYIAFRAYGNLLNNWYSEFRCPRGKKVIRNNSKCADYEAKLKEKKDKRYKNTER
ncbi:unnamed protein product [Spodoptera littoralis]|uniref:Uncharacterized protein n=1 Tax=Spodoptera littoralis TaxID=7109 RepID=A0A9P0MZ36_SPOLI|nr:unnamed protein product [Spodoptera littoralis]CAH1636577.1 unnamed protein product [Spodoptera littoralis]